MHKKPGLQKKSIYLLSALGFGLVLIWTAFYVLTRFVISHNMTEQVQSTFDAVISRIEEEILVIDDTAYSLAHYDGVRDMAAADDVLSFYDAGASIIEKTDVIIGGQTPVDNAAVYGRDGFFYRLKGSMSNTMLEKVYDMIKGGDKKSLWVSEDKMAYIGSVEQIQTDSGTDGFVVLFMDRTQLEKILHDYSGMEHVGIIIRIGDDLLCSNMEEEITDIHSFENTSAYYKEKQIGFTGISLIVYCAVSPSSPLSAYFAVALPVTVILFGVIAAVFFRYLNRQLVALRLRDAEIDREKTLISLLKKQINAHFTVNTLNVVRSLVNTGRSREASATCEELSILLRYANAGEESISLMEEFYILEQYAAIMQTRYPKKFSFETPVEDVFERVRIPRMLLQPIVENAILHGLADQSGRIWIDARIVGDEVVVEVSDDGRGMAADELEHLRARIAKAGSNWQEEKKPAEGGSHLALVNIERRIRLVCGSDYGISISAVPGGGTCVRLRLRAMA